MNDEERALEKLQDKLEPAVYARYKAKILAAKEDGKLAAAIEAREKEAAATKEAAKALAKKKEAAMRAGEVEANANDADPEGARKLRAEMGQDTTMATLDSIMKVDMLEKLTTQQVGDLWAEHHKNIDCVGAVIPSQLYMQIRARANECPLFLYPLPRDDGIEFFLAQWVGNQCAFTPLIEYKTHQDNASPYLLLNNYTELVDSKGIVLMNSDIDTKMTVADAHLLTNQMQIYYLGDEETFDIVRNFSSKPDEFNYQELIERLETLNQKALESTPAQKAVKDDAKA